MYEGADLEDTSKILPFFDFLEGEILNKSDLETSIANSLNYYEDSGNPFARIIINSVYVYYDSLKDESLADIYLDFKKGKTEKSTGLKLSGIPLPKIM